MMSAAFAWMDRQCFLGGPSGAAHLHSGDHPVFGRFCSPAFCFRWTDFNTLRDRHAWGLPFCDTLSRNGGRPRTCLGLPVSFFCVDARHVSGFCVLRVMEWVRPWGIGLVCRTRAIASFKIRSDTVLCRFLVVVA